MMSPYTMMLLQLHMLQLAALYWLPPKIEKKPHLTLVKD